MMVMMVKKRHYVLSWQRLCLVGVVLLALVAITASVSNFQRAVAQAGARASTVRHGTLPVASGHGTLTYLRTITFAQAAQMKPRGKVQPWSALPAKWHGPMSAAQQAAYQRNVTHLPGLAQVAAQPQVLPQAGPSATVPATPTPNFDACGYKDIPCKTYGFVGPHGPGTGNYDLPDFAVASNPSYVLVSDGSYITAYNFAGAVVAGPVLAATFFGVPVGTGDLGTSFVSPVALNWDATRQHWVMAVNAFSYDMFGNLNSGFYEVAVSVGDTPNLNATTAWNLFAVTMPSTGGSANYCVGLQSQLQFGMDYWGLWLTCGEVWSTASGANVGNAVLVVNKNQLYTRVNGYVFAFPNIPSGVSCGSGCLKLAGNFIPALEDGTPDAEFLLATDAGYGGPFSDLVTVAFTNTHAVVHDLAPTASYVITTLPQPYADPMNASQPGQNGVISIAPGISSIQYKGGDLLAAWTTTAVFSGVTHDGAYWLDETPQLTSLNPSNPAAQQAATPLLRNVGIYGFSKSDAYAPVLIASSELDETLVMTDSSNTVTIYPSVLYTGRRATDAPNVMGVNVAYSFTIGGTADINPTYYYYYGNACSLDTNLTSRGLVWCIGQYGGPDFYDSYIAGLSNE